MSKMARENNARNEEDVTTPLLKPIQQDDIADHDTTSEEDEEEWSSEGNKRNPQNWTSAYKWLTVALVSFIEFLT